MLASGAWEWLTTINPELRFVAVVVAIGSVLVAVLVLIHTWWRIRQSAERSAMVRDMLQRGFSADEIARLLIVADYSAEESDDENVSADEDPEAHLVKWLSDQWYDGGDIERILTAARSSGSLDETTVRIIKSLVEGWEDSAAIVKVLESRRMARDASSIQSISA